MFVRGIFLCAIAAGILALPARATITYTYCSSGCSSTGGTYSSFETAPGTTGLAFSSPITFISGDLSGTPAFYTDTSTGATFTGYTNSTGNANNSSNTLSALNVSGTNLNMGINGTGSGIQITLPANTYAFAMVVSASTGGASTQMLELGDRIVNNANYELSITSVGNQVFFAIVSDTPLTTLFLGNPNSFSGDVQIQSFELGDLAPTPEPTTAFLIGGGLTGLGLLRRRQRTTRHRA